MVVPHLQPMRREHAIHPVVKLLITLNFIATGSYQTPVGMSSFTNVCQKSISNALHEIVPVLAGPIMGQYIRFPASSKECDYLENMPGVFGILDGTHIQIVTPSNEPNLPARLFRNRKGTNSLNVMAVVNSNREFLRVNAKFPGSVHDAAVWQMSRAKAFLEDRFEENRPLGYLLADLGYASEPWVLIPLRGNIPPNITADQARAYNQAHRENRTEIERSFGELKNTWRALLSHRVLHYSSEFAGEIVNSAFTLHNFKKRHQRENDFEIENEDDDSDDEDQELPNLQAIPQAGIAARTRYIQQNF